MALHHRTVNGAAAAAAALALALVPAACSLPSSFIGTGDAGPGGSEAGGLDAGACTAPRCDGPDALLDCQNGLEVRTKCPLGCNETFEDHCNECVPSTTTCEASGDLVACNALGTADPMPCLAGACEASPPACAPCPSDTAGECYGGKILACAGGAQTTVDACAGGYGCSSTPSPHCNDCPPGQLYCAISGDVVQCTAEGEAGSITEACALGCSDDPAPRCHECTPGANTCGSDGNVYDCPDGLLGARLETCAGGLCGGGACRNPIAPSNVPPSLLAAATAEALGDWADAVATCATPWDTVVVDTDTGLVRCFDGTTSRGTVRASGTGLTSGIWFEVAAGTGGAPDLGVFVLGAFDVPAGKRVRFAGDGAGVVVATGCVTIDGAVLAGGGAYTLASGAPFAIAADNGTIAGGAGDGGPGGFDGGAADGNPPSAGPGAGGEGNASSGEQAAGGGGGHGGPGGDGGDATAPEPDAAGGTGGAAYWCGGSGGTATCAAGATDFNAALIPLAGGSGGNGAGEDASSGRGGGGGGAIQIVSLASCGVEVGPAGVIDAGGEGGTGGTGNDYDGGGGGAGGAILLEGYRVIVFGAVTANGGGGGGGDGDSGGSAGDGDRGRFDAVRAAAGGGTGGGSAGGRGGAGTATDGEAGADDNTAPGGGGGASGRIRLNAFELSTGSANTVISPPLGTSAATTGTPATP